MITNKIPIISYFTGDRQPNLDFTLRKSDGSGVLDLTGASSAKCHLREVGAISNVFSGSNENASIVGPPTQGLVRYTMPTGGIVSAGVYMGQVRVVWPTGDQHTQEFELRVEQSY